MVSGDSRVQNAAAPFIVGVQKILFPIIPYRHFTVSCLILSKQSILPILISI